MQLTQCIQTVITPQYVNYIKQTVNIKTIEIIEIIEIVTINGSNKILQIWNVSVTLLIFESKMEKIICYKLLSGKSLALRVDVDIKRPFFSRQL